MTDVYKYDGAVPINPELEADGPAGDGPTDRREEWPEGLCPGDRGCLCPRRKR